MRATLTAAFATISAHAIAVIAHTATEKARTISSFDLIIFSSSAVAYMPTATKRTFLSLYLRARGTRIKTVFPPLLDVKPPRMDAGFLPHLMPDLACARRTTSVLFYFHLSRSKLLAPARKR